MKNSRWQWMEYAGLFSLFLTLISLAVGVTINFRPLYVFDIGHLQILDYTSLDQETLLKNFDHLMNYLNNPFKPSSACQISQFLLAEPITFMK